MTTRPFLPVVLKRSVLFTSLNSDLFPYRHGLSGRVDPYWRINPP